MTESDFKLMREIRTRELVPHPVIAPTEKTKKLAANRIKNQLREFKKSTDKNGWEL